jgi:hypothetical protein
MSGRSGELLGRLAGVWTWSLSALAGLGLQRHNHANPFERNWLSCFRRLSRATQSQGVSEAFISCHGRTWSACQEVKHNGTKQMPELDDLLDEAEQLHKRMQGALGSGGSDVARDIIQLRSKFASAISGILKEMWNDPRLNGNADLRREFEQRFMEVRQKLAEHQAKFRMGTIESELANYKTSSAELDKVQKEFYSWAKSVLN